MTSNQELIAALRLGNVDRAEDHPTTERSGTSAASGRRCIRPNDDEWPESLNELGSHDP
jgi:hypothetical protein